MGAVDSMLGTVVEKGFETVLDQPVRGGGYAVALGKDGNGLGRTVVVAPLVVPKAHGV